MDASKANDDYVDDQDDPCGCLGGAAAELEVGEHSDKL
jgi:hypothetical protein